MHPDLKLWLVKKLPDLELWLVKMCCYLELHLENSVISHNQTTFIIREYCASTPTIGVTKDSLQLKTHIPILRNDSPNYTSLKKYKRSLSNKEPNFRLGLISQGIWSRLRLIYRYLYFSSNFFRKKE